MAVGYARLPAELVVGLAETSRVGELETDEKVVGRTKAFPLSLGEGG